MGGIYTSNITCECSYDCINLLVANTNGELVCYGCMGTRERVNSVGCFWGLNLFYRVAIEWFEFEAHAGWRDKALKA